MRHKILCIDDETHNLEALERLLRKQYKPICVSSGEAGLDQLDLHDFSLIISDQKMPEMTGVEFFMKAKKIQPEAIRILLTGYTDLESVIDAINQGQIYRYITKPWDPDELLGLTRQAIEVFEMKGLIQKQNQELQEANEKLKSLDTLKSDFMLLVNHELKTPLTGIFSYVQLLKEESLSDDIALYVNKIEKNTSRLQTLINDTLLITRLKANTILEQEDQCNLTDLIESQWKTLAQEYPSSSLRYDLKADTPFVQLGNQKYLQIVVEKLLRNIYVHAKPDSPVLIQLDENSTHWSLNISNEPKTPINKDLNELLNAFSTDKPILNHAGGTGLGLAIVNTIVKLCSGQLLIDTEDSSFRTSIQFPLPY